MSDDDIIILSSGSEEEERPKRSVKSRKRRIPLKTVRRGVSASHKISLESSDEIEEIVDTEEEEAKDNRPGTSKSSVGGGHSKIKTGRSSTKHARTNDTSDAPGSDEDDIVVIDIVASADNPVFKLTSDKLLQMVKQKIEEAQFQKFHQKYLSRVNQLIFKSEVVLKHAVDLVSTALNDLEEKPKKIWKTLNILLEALVKLGKNQLKMIKESKKQKKSILSEAERLEKKRLRRIAVLEGGMERTDRLIREHEQRVHDDSDDAEDDKYMTYVVEGRMKKRFVRYYNEWCALQNQSTKTNRPIEHKISLEKVTPYETINEHVAEFVNQKDDLFMPDFVYVRNIVAKEAKRLSVPEDCWNDLAVKLFERVVALIKQKRGEDFQAVAFSHIEVESDEPDEELKQKLEENLRSMKSEHEVISKFVKEEPALTLVEHIEISDDVADESAPESQDESDEDESPSDDDKILKDLDSDEESILNIGNGNDETADRTSVDKVVKDPKIKPADELDHAGSVSAADNILQISEGPAAIGFEEPLTKRIRLDATIIASEMDSVCMEAGSTTEVVPAEESETPEDTRIHASSAITESGLSFPNASVATPSGSDDITEVT